MKTVRTRASGTVRKKQIKAAALEIIFDEGLKRLSTKNIAAHVHLSEGAIFRHFHSKDEIILSILSDLKKELLFPLYNIAWQPQIPAEKRLEEFMCFHFDYLKKHNGVTILLFTEAAYQNSNFLKNELNAFFSHIKQYFEKIIQDGITAGIWDKNLEVDALSSLYIGMPITMSVETKLITETFSEKKFCPQMLELVHRLLAIHKSKKEIYAV